jgi:glutathione S-transferase
MLEKRLKAQKERFEENETWLVWDKMRFADLSFVVLQKAVLRKEGFDTGGFPLIKAWLGRMGELENVKETVTETVQS